MKKIFFILLFFLFAVPCLAENKILINEFLIDPQPQQVEIINTSTEEADISGWIIDDSGGTTYYTVPQSNILHPNSCLVFSGDFNLNKSSVDIVRLINNSQQLIDSFSYKSSSGSGITYQRLPDGTDFWTTGSANLGKFNSSTDQACLFPTLTPTPTSTPLLTPTLEITPTSIPISTEIIAPTPYTLTPTPYNNIFISEAMIYPQPGNNEWIEIYNDNDYSVSLNNWFIDDIENDGSSPKSFASDIPAKSYYVFNLSSSMFNNGGDSVRLLDNNKNLKDSFEYSGGDQGKTFGRTSLDSDDFCQQEPSNGTINNSCINLPTIASETTGRINPSPTTLPSIKPILINKPARRNLDEGGSINIQKPVVPTVINEQGEILGAKNNLLIRSSNNKSLINTLLFISCTYSLLTMISILIKMRLIYEKIAQFLP